ncbi:MAG: hypothetical protein M3Q56_08055 [Bacteroidota bacterium]|nr:hypothetical protein [Bacteroidota bacterium]
MNYSTLLLRARTLILFALFYFIGSNVLWSQIDVVATVGTPMTSYLTLKDAFNAINAGTHTNSITINVTGNTTETATAVLNASVKRSSFYNILIQPSGGAARTIMGAMSAGNPLEDLNGADVLINYFKLFSA